MTQNLRQLGFNKNHYALLSFAVVLFAILLIGRSGFKVSAMFTKAEDVPAPTITYEQTRSEVYAQLGVGENDQYLQELDKQFALLDRGDADGAVLGDSIGIGAVPNADELILPEVEQAYPLKISEQSFPQQELNYLSQVQDLEIRYDATTMLADLNSSDTNLIRSSVGRWQSLLTDLSSIAVPSSMQDYQRTKIYYYYSIMKIGSVYAGLEDEESLTTYLKVMIGFGNKLNQYEKTN